MRIEIAGKLTLQSVFRSLRVPAIRQAFAHGPGHSNTSHGRWGLPRHVHTNVSTRQMCPSQYFEVSLPAIGSDEQEARASGSPDPVVSTP